MELDFLTSLYIHQLLVKYLENAFQYSTRNSRQRSRSPIPEIPQSWHDVLFVIKRGIYPCADDLDLFESFAHVLQALWACNKV